MKNSKPFNRKIIIAGNVVQIYEYEKPQNCNMPTNPFVSTGIGQVKFGDVDGLYNVTNDFSEKEIQELFNLKHKMTKEELEKKAFNKKYTENSDKLALEEEELKRLQKAINDKKNAIRKRNKVIRLVNSNPQLKTFLTLTFADNITDLEVANKEFKTFIQRLNYLLDYKFEYVAVVEFQKRGAVHYHLLCNLQCDFEISHKTKKKNDNQKYYEWLLAKNVWKNGFVTVQPLTSNPEKYSKDVDNLGAYLVKYMTKEVENNLLEGKKNYFTSKGLNKPIEITELNIKAEYRYTYIKDLDNTPPTYVNTYTSKYTGIVTFKEYNLCRLNLIDIPPTPIII